MNEGIHAPGSLCSSSISDRLRSLDLLLTRQQIAARVAEMGAEISRDFAGKNLLLIGVLKGAAIFLADLIRAVSVECTFEFVSAKSYGAGVESHGIVQVSKNLEQPLKDRNVLLVEDILDSGATLRLLHQGFAAEGPATLKIAAFLDKPSRRRVEITADYVGFTIPDRFVVGYGMDFAERYRQLPDIHFLRQTIQTSSTPPAADPILE